MSVEDLRKTGRIERHLPVRFWHDGREFQTSSRNISLGGLFMISDAALPFEARIQLRFRLPGQREDIEVEAEVRWIERAPDGAVRGIGVRFEGMRARDTWALTRYLNSPAAPPPPPR